MPDTLYPAGGQMVQTGINAGMEGKKLDLLQSEQSQKTMEAGLGAVRDVQGDRNKIMAVERLKQMEAMENKIEITPQLALGLVKNTGDKDWLSAVGQRMRADVYTALYTHGMAVNQSKRAPKVTQIYDEKGKIRHAVIYTDDQGNIQQLPLDTGFTPEQLHPPKPGTGTSPEDKKNKEFMRSHEKQAALFNDPVKSKQLKAMDPEQWNMQHEEYMKDQDRYDKLKTSLGKGGGGPAGTGGGDSAVPDNSPFDSDAFIQSALGQ